MRIERHAFHRRTVFCVGLGLALLGHVPLAHAATADMPFTSFMERVTGNSNTVGFTGSGAPVAARAPAALGGTSGWTYASNFGVSSGPSGGYKVATSGDISVGKHKVPVNLVGQASKAASAAAVAKTFMAIGRAGAGPIGLMFAAPAILDYLQLNDVRKNPDPSDSARPFVHRRPIDSMGYRVGDLGSFYESQSAACSAAVADKNKQEWTSASIVSTSPHCSISIKNTYPPATSPAQVYAFAYEQKITPFYVDVPSSLSDIEPYLLQELSPSKLPSFIDETERFRRLYPDAGIEPFRINLDQGETVTGPATLPASQPVVKTTTTPGTGGSTVTTTTTSTTQPKLNYSGSTVTATEKTVTTTVTNTCTGDGSCTTTSNTDAPDVEEKPAEEDTDLCKQNPDIVACAKTDTPEEDIPKATKELTYSEDTMFSGGGSCPADKVMTLHTGQTVKVWDWQQGCSWIVTYVRPILLVVASYIAVMMLVPKT